MDFGKSNTVVMFDDCSTEAKLTFNNNWEMESRVVTQTATEENLTSLERNDTGSKLVYIGDQNDIQGRVETSGGICFSSADFVTITQAMVASLSSAFRRDIINTGIENPRRFANKIRKLKRLGINFKIQEDDLR